ncbi:MAG: hypothetical protein HXS52_00865 [Theionarchaea archaeon]|nr:hypothetical protein [Theionarchaea archaeon]MBU7036454.1 hypothetical protein [Theionarchaea archaeon]
MSMRWGVLLLLLVVQLPGFRVDITVDESFYEPGEPMRIEVTIENRTSGEEWLQSVRVEVSDSQHVVYTVEDTYPAGTERLDAAATKVYQYGCDLPLNVSPGLGTAEVTVKTWGGVEILKKTFFEIGVNYPPEITGVSYPHVINPAQEYALSFSVSDNFGVEDLTSVQVTLYQKSKTPSERECYIFSWEAPNIYTVWKSDFPVQAAASVTPTEIAWTLTFSLGEIAAPGDWILLIEAIDTEYQPAQVSEHVAVTRYMSFRVEDSTGSSMTRVDFGKGSPGEQLSGVSLYVVVTSNSGVNISVEGSNLYSPEGNMLPVEAFYVEVSGQQVQLTGDKQVIYPNYAGSRGFSQNDSVHLIFWGVLPEAMEAGTYSGIWYIIVEAV